MWLCYQFIFTVKQDGALTNTNTSTTTTTYLYLPPPYIKCSFTRRTLPQAGLCINFTSTRFWVERARLDKYTAANCMAREEEDILQTQL